MIPLWFNSSVAHLELSLQICDVTVLLESSRTCGVYKSRCRTKPVIIKHIVQEFVRVVGIFKP